VLHPIAIISPRQNQEGELNELEDKWDELLFSLIVMATGGEPTEAAVAQLNVSIGSLHLVQPFNWNEWAADFPSREQIAELSLADCVRHITRIVRLNRFSEGVLFNAVRSGQLLALCMRAKEMANGEPIPHLLGKAN
jgi:hypothetical protein